MGRSSSPKGVDEMSEDGFVYNKEDDAIPDDVKRRIEEESFGLVEGRLYIVLDSTNNESVNVRCYDTTNKEEISPAHVMCHGMVEIMNSENDYVLSVGHEIVMNYLNEAKQENEEVNITAQDLGNNIIKVNFGSKH